jgi:hypothetical protein
VPRHETLAPPPRPSPTKEIVSLSARIFQGGAASLSEFVQDGGGENENGLPAVGDSRNDDRRFLGSDAKRREALMMVIETSVSKKRFCTASVAARICGMAGVGCDDWGQP